ncbi:MAG: hypothetical protein ACFB0C_12330 [Leptolyngbyaceae cyanobacterium]
MALHSRCSKFGFVVGNQLIPIAPVIADGQQQVEAIAAGLEGHHQAAEVALILVGEVVQVAP